MAALDPTSRRVRQRLTIDGPMRLFGRVMAVRHAGADSTLRDAGAAEGVLRGNVLIESTNAGRARAHDRDGDAMFLGFRSGALDVGGPEHAHELEAMTAVIIPLLGGGADPLSAFRFLLYPPPGRRRLVQPNELGGKVAVVTGASGGIGAAIARELASRSMAVGLAYGFNAKAAEAVSGDIARAVGHAIVLKADLRSAAAAEELVDSVEQALGAIDVLIANAGQGQVASYEEVDARRFDETIAVNLRAPYLLARRVLPGMIDRGFGRVIFVSSVAAFTGGIVGPHYAASKAGLHGLTHYIAARTASHGVTVNAIAPALIGDTGMVPGDPRQLARAIPVGRLGTAVEVAKVTLAVVQNDYLTNQVISLDGGIHPR
jgi:3-oxoacyl-[acyl-carrier protein] reductase